MFRCFKLLSFEFDKLVFYRTKCYLDTFFSRERLPKYFHVKNISTYNVLGINIVPEIRVTLGSTLRNKPLLPNVITGLIREYGKNSLFIHVDCLLSCLVRT